MAAGPPAVLPWHLFEADLAAPRQAKVGAGRVVVHSMRAPEGDGPNEDAAAVVPAGDATWLVVADGYGGGALGERAAKAAVDAVAEAAATGADPVGALVQGVRDANERALALGNGAATTLLAAVVRDGAIATLSVGDSMLLVVGQRGKIKLRTVPHSPVGYAVESGWLDEDEAMHHEARHYVSNMVGEPTLRAEITFGTRLAPRDTVVLGTDGLWDNMHVDEVVEVVRAGSLVEAASTLVRTCRERMASPNAGLPSKCDDCTFVMYRPGGG